MLWGAAMVGTISYACAINASGRVAGIQEVGPAPEGDRPAEGRGEGEVRTTSGFGGSSSPALRCAVTWPPTLREGDSGSFWSSSSS